MQEHDEQLIFEPRTQPITRRQMAPCRRCAIGQHAFLAATQVRDSVKLAADIMSRRLAVDRCHRCRHSSGITFSELCLEAYAIKSACVAAIFRGFIRVERMLTGCQNGRTKSRYCHNGFKNGHESRMLIEHEQCNACISLGT
jgi:hypothetical protein